MEETVGGKRRGFAPPGKFFVASRVTIKANAYIEAMWYGVIYDIWAITAGMEYNMKLCTQTEKKTPVQPIARYQ